ncbi:MAG: transporter substrate-binding domain-containing protein [Alphaproteobacteria bacterium]
MTAARLAAALLLAFAAAAGLRQGSAAADALDAIRSRGVLIVGTKADYQPFGFRDASGAIVGFEPDLAAAVAHKLDVKLELVPVVAANRLELLAAGKVDLVIATMNDTPERRKLADFVEPSYYASGVNVLAAKSLNLHVWQELARKRICTIGAAFYVEEIRRRYDPEILTFQYTDEIYAALKAGTCIAALYDDTALIGQLQKPEWSSYEMPFRSILVEPWGLAVKLGETPFATLLSDLVKDWHKSGRIQELEKKWHIPASGFAEEMHRRYLEEK